MSQPSDPSAPSHQLHEQGESPAAHVPAPPSSLAGAQSTQVDEAPQQGATQPDSGSLVYVVQTAPQPTFKEQVIGHAKDIRGSILRKPETKEYGQKILKGEASYPPREDA
ncbi:hypothetical protein B0H21DRAFT_326077 [Amylocystis lapponica]|nr:hypothetical protein B0H21DRAFT_326077 [Amylocystis lapponica]